MVFCFSYKFTNFIRERRVGGRYCPVSNIIVLLRNMYRGGIVFYLFLNLLEEDSIIEASAVVHFVKYCWRLFNYD